MASSEVTTGLPMSCECGNIRFRTPTSEPAGMAYCHCTACRKQSGSAFGTSVYFSSEGLFPLPEELEAKLAMFTHPTDSGNTMRCYFCPKCGVRIFHAIVLPDGSLRSTVAFKGGVIDEGIDWKAMKPRNIFTRSAVMDIPNGWECSKLQAP
ncbi:Mss4-like protein [Lasiosphaeria ovina]|uniref:Mss4-like protein n=1 Tax=Lasiosphaeria ovina TaxID=92902 RepID=A0AAE0KLY4_9PEZI|nr:Mss4-like protein [Lasiosphaeria ovina]